MRAARLSKSTPSRSCKIFVLNNEGDQVEAGQYVLTGSVIEIKAKPEYERLLLNLREHPGFDDGKDVKSETNPKLWFELLPETFHGSRVRAEMV